MIAHAGRVINEEGVRCFIRFKYQQKFRFSLRKYEPFDLDDISDAECKSEFRFYRNDIHDYFFISNWLISNSTEMLPKIKQLKNAQY